MGTTEQSGDENMRLAGKVAIVTGGGSGMGRAIVLAFVREGARVVVADRDQQTADKTVSLVKEAGGEAVAVKVDVTKKAETLQMRDEAVRAFGRIDILINNAGARCLKGFLEHTEEDWHHMLNVNLTGHFLCSQAVVPNMLENGKGKIVNLASIAAHTGRPDRVAYCAAKAGVMGLTRAMAMDLRGKNICVTAISPGSIATPMNEAAATSTNVDWGGETVMGRWGTADDVANAAVFLASNESDYITGSEIQVEGGWLIGRARDGEI
jgi:NAD(P)-dependent dehydrogenase (short-subunit alcohol dehydrogenase family)